MAEIHVCEHIEAVTLGPNDRMAIVVPENITEAELNWWSEAVAKWWPDRVLVVAEPLRIVAMTDGDL